MTEDEAKIKWCPFARYVSHNGEGINRWVTAEDTQLSPDPAKCIGSACMAWREKPKTWQHGSPIGPYEDRKEIDGYGQKGKPLPIQGFCGLAGEAS